MRIGIEAQRLFRARKHGMDVVALELLRRLPALAPEHTFVAFVRPGEDPCLEPTANLEVVEVEGRSYPSWEQVALPRAAAQAGVDLLHCTANTAPRATLARLAKEPPNSSVRRLISGDRNELAK